MRLKERRWRTTAAVAVLALALACAGVILLLVRPGSQQASARARQYTSSQACLLTDSRGITSPPAATVWAGMEDASADTHAMVSYLSADGPATAANAIPYANSLIERRCDIILAVGAPQAGALTQIAPRTPKANFVIIGSGTAFAAANLKTIGLSSGTRGQVKQAVEAIGGR